MFIPGEPVLTKNSTAIPTGSSVGVSAGDVFVLTAQSAGFRFGRLEFTNSAQNTKIYDWVVDDRLAPTSTTTTPVASTVIPGGGSSSDNASGVTTDPIAPAFTG